MRHLLDPFPAHLTPPRDENGTPKPVSNTTPERRFLAYLHSRHTELRLSPLQYSAHQLPPDFDAIQRFYQNISDRYTQELGEPSEDIKRLGLKRKRTTDLKKSKETLQGILLLQFPYLQREVTSKGIGISRWEDIPMDMRFGSLTPTVLSEATAYRPITPVKNHLEKIKNLNRSYISYLKNLITLEKLIFTDVYKASNLDSPKILDTTLLFKPLYLIALMYLSDISEGHQLFQVKKQLNFSSLMSPKEHLFDPVQTLRDLRHPNYNALRNPQEYQVFYSQYQSNLSNRRRQAYLFICFI